uniref:Uncharacterized protein n=1 Tax=Arundo donax TaxID=35708 RepID=A0A0A8XN91_ARUDO
MEETAHMYAVLLEDGQVGLDHFLYVAAEDVIVQLEGLEKHLEGASDREPEAEIRTEGAAAEGGAGVRDEERDLGSREAEVGELGDAGS